MRCLSPVLTILALLASSVIPCAAQGDVCSHGTAVYGVTALLNTYARGESSAIEEILELLVDDPAYLVHCSNGYGETDEVVMEVAARHFSTTGQPARAVSIIEAFAPFLEEKVRTRWLVVRDSLSENRIWPSRNDSWDGEFSIIPFPQASAKYVRLMCGGHDEEYGLVFGEGGSHSAHVGMEGVGYTLGLRSITILIGYAWPYGAAIKYGQAFSSLDEAAEVLCGE